MKIDFDATYKDIARITSSSDKRVYSRRGGAGFGRLLGSIAPDRPQPIENKDLINKTANSTKPVSEEDRGPMASFKFSAPQLAPPALEALKNQSLEQESGTEDQGSVKTPALLSLRRIPGRSVDDPRKVETKASVGKMVDAAARTHGVDPSLGMSIITVESDFNSRAVSKDGHESKGLFQLLDTTGKDMHKKFGVEDNYDPFNPEQNVNLGVGYLRYLHEIFSQSTELPNQSKTIAAANSSSLEKLAVAAFNAGEGRVAAAQGMAARNGRDPAQYDLVAPYLPESTKEYVQRVMTLKSSYEDPFIG